MENENTCQFMGELTINDYDRMAHICSHPENDFPTCPYNKNNVLRCDLNPNSSRYKKEYDINKDDK